MSARDHTAPCTDSACDRERGHPGMHMSRTWDPMTCTEIIDEWGNVDLRTLATPQDGKGDG